MNQFSLSVPSSTLSVAFLSVPTAIVYTRTPKAFGIRVYTIAAGSDKTTTDKVDEGTLREIAKISEGKFFRATDARSLENIFKEINLFEKTEIKQNQYRNVQDFYHPYLRWAIVFFLISFALKSTFMGNILED